MNRADLLYSVLADGRPHGRHEIFRACGEFFLTNNAASELRARGIDVTHTVKDGVHVYQLVGSTLDAAGEPRIPTPPSPDVVAESPVASSVSPAAGSWLTADSCGGHSDPGLDTLPSLQLSILEVFA